MTGETRTRTAQGWEASPREVSEPGTQLVSRAHHPTRLISAARQGWAALGKRAACAHARRDGQQLSKPATPQHSGQAAREARTTVRGRHQYNKNSKDGGPLPPAEGLGPDAAVDAETISQ